MAQLKKQLEVTRLTRFCFKTKPLFPGKNPLTNLNNSHLTIKYLHSNLHLSCVLLMFSGVARKENKAREFLHKSGKQPKFITPLLGLLDAQCQRQGRCLPSFTSFCFKNDNEIIVCRVSEFIGILTFRWNVVAT